MLSAIAFCSVFALIIVAASLNTSRDAPSPAWRWTVVAGGVVAAALCVAVVWESLVPGNPLAEGKLASSADSLALGGANGGVLKLLAEPAPGVKKEGQSVLAYLLITGDEGTQRQRFEFRLGDKPGGAEDMVPALSQLAGNLVLEPLGDNAVARLERLEPKDTAVVGLIYYGRRVPFRLAAIILTVLTVLAALFEALTPASHRRSFLTVSVGSAAALVWLLVDGLAGSSPVSILMGRVLWASVAGMITGTLGPLLLRAILPKPRRAPLDDDDEPEPTAPA